MIALANEIWMEVSICQLQTEALIRIIILFRLMCSRDALGETYTPDNFGSKQNGHDWSYLAAAAEWQSSWKISISRPWGNPNQTWPSLSLKPASQPKNKLPNLTCNRPTSKTNKFLLLYVFLKVFYSALLWCVLSCFSCIPLFVTPWTVALQALLSMKFSKQEYWSGLPSSPLGDSSLI